MKTVTMIVHDNEKPENRRRIERKVICRSKRACPFPFSAKTGRQLKDNTVPSAVLYNSNKEEK